MNLDATSPGPPSRFERTGRVPAAIVLALLVAALIAACWPSTAQHAAGPKLRANAEQSDLDLYRTIVRRVHGGEDYYRVAAEEQRKDGYPLRPFITFRLPTVATAYARAGTGVMTGVQLLLALTVLLVWWRRLRSESPLWQRAAGMFLLSAGVAGLVEPVTGLFQESWAALLMALSIGVRRPGQAAAAVVAGSLALLVRETALPFVLMMAGLALIERRWREAAGWVVGVALFATYMAWHAARVAEVVLPNDLASPGWQALLGAGFALKAMAAVNAATILPGTLAAALLILSLFGWISLRTEWALRAALLMLGYGAMLALFARADTFYWALLASPLSLVGAIYAPRAIRDLVAALDRTGDRVAQAPA